MTSLSSVSVAGASGRGDSRFEKEANGSAPSIGAMRPRNWRSFSPEHADLKQQSLRRLRQEIAPDVVRVNASAKTKRPG